VSETAGGIAEGIEKIQYKPASGATAATHFCSRTFENAVWHTDGVFRVLKARRLADDSFRPDLIVGHSGFGSTLFLPELFPNVPVVNLFEYYYVSCDPESDMDFRRDLPWKVPEIKYLRSRCRNAMILLDLQNCDMGYVPTEFQRSKFPAEYQPKLRTIFDGVDRAVYHGYGEALRPAVHGARQIAGVDVPPGTRVVTYVSRGFESMRGFDVFLKMAKLIYRQFPDVLFLIAGTDRIAYGGDENYVAPHKTFKEWALAQDEYDLSKFRFLGKVPSVELGRMLAASDLHIYLTVPFVLSWSMMDAMSCGAVVLGSDTSPVREMIRDGENGLLADFFSPEALAAKAVEVLRDPAAYRPLGRSAEGMIVEKYSMEAVMPQMLGMYEEAVNRRRMMPVLPEPELEADAPVQAKGAGKSPFLG
jgi:glycosyltransferase involved in cell wall biosynthesis